jgi:large repetitive protein
VLATLVAAAAALSILPVTATAAPKQPSVTVADVVVAESAGTATFVIKAKPRPRSALSVDWTTADGAATSPADYVAASGTVTLTSSGSTVRISIPITADVLDEPDETFLVNLSNLVGAPGAIGDAQAVGTITDDDAVPTIALDDAVLGEGETGTTAATFPIGLSAPSGRTVTVQWATTDGTATQPTDYAPASGTVTFLPGDMSETISVTVNGDTALELDETFTVALSAPTNATVSDGAGTATIVADEVEPVVSIGDASIDEGDAGAASVDLTVSLSRAGLVDSTVDWATSDGTAVAPGDYSAASGTVTFAAGDVAETVSVAIGGDEIHELDETLTVTLSNVNSAFMGDHVAVGTIFNDDPIPSVAITDVSVPEGDTATVSAVFDVTLSAPSGAQADVGWTTVDGTALGGTDYAPDSGVLSFASGDVTESLAVVVNGDTVDEPNEWLGVVLSGPDGAAIADGTGRATILDDDKTPTALTLGVRKRARRVIGSGRLEPAMSGFAVTVTFARRRANGTYARLRSRVVTVTGIRDRDGDGLSEGVYRVAFTRPSRRGTYRITARFLGTTTHGSSSKQVTFTIP